MNIVKFQNTFRHFLKDRLPQSDEYEVSRRISDTHERVDDMRPFSQTLIVFDRCMAIDNQKILSTAVVGALKKNRSMFSAVSVSDWDGTALVGNANGRLINAEKYLSEAHPFSSNYTDFSTFDAAIQPLTQSAELILLILSQVIITSMETKRYSYAKKTLILTCDNKDWTKADLGAQGFSILSLQK